MKRKSFPKQCEGFLLQKLFDDNEKDESMEEDIPYNDEFNDMESTSEEEDQQDDEPKVCSINFISV